MNHPNDIQLILYDTERSETVVDSQGPSRQLYLGVFVESSKLGINPCFSVLPNAKICSLAPLKLPVVKNSPLSEMNYPSQPLQFQFSFRQERQVPTTSRPQHLAQPAAKCGNPAARLATGLLGDILALLTRPYICTLHKARSCVSECPDETKSEHCSTTALRAALYAV